MILSGLLSQLSGGSVDGYRSLCGEGDMQGCYHLGVAYSKGDGVHSYSERVRIEWVCKDTSLPLK